MRLLTGCALSIALFTGIGCTAADTTEAGADVSENASELASGRKYALSCDASYASMKLVFDPSETVAQSASARFDREPTFPLTCVREAGPGPKAALRYSCTGVWHSGRPEATTVMYDIWDGSTIGPDRLWRAQQYNVDAHGARKWQGMYMCDYPRAVAN
jgi:hypothetical protein